MAKLNIQNKIVSSGTTLPVALVLGSLVYLFVSLFHTVPTPENSYPFWQLLADRMPAGWVGKVLNYVLYGLVSYLLLEFNNAFSIIRVRTSIHVSLYLFFVLSCLFLLPFQAGNIAGICFFSAIGCLFWGGRQQEPVMSTFNAMLLLSLGSLLFPQLLFFVPVFYWGSIILRIFVLKSFFAGLLGLLLPYWFLFGHAYFYGRMEVFYTPFVELFTFRAIDYSSISMQTLAPVSLFLLLFVVSAFHYFAYSYQDKIRTRGYLVFLTVTALLLVLLAVLQPCHLYTSLQLFLPILALLGGHFFALQGSFFSNLFFVLTLLATLLLLIAVWIP